MNYTRSEQLMYLLIDGWVKEDKLLMIQTPWFFTLRFYVSRSEINFLFLNFLFAM